MKSIEELGISPGPWCYGETRDIISVCDSYRRIVHSSGIGFEHGMPNARLIAAAPELYEVLRKMLECFDYIRSTAWFWDENFASVVKMNEALNEAQSVLTKASGEEVRDDN